MTDRRFLSILNQVAGAMGSELFEPGGTSGDAAAIAAWARFLQSCVERGISVGDTRWRILEMKRTGGRARFSLPGTGDDSARGAGDFSVGLALLMAMLGRDEEEPS